MPRVWGFVWAKSPVYKAVAETLQKLFGVGEVRETGNEIIYSAPCPTTPTVFRFTLEELVSVGKLNDYSSSLYNPFPYPFNCSVTINNIPHAANYEFVVQPDIVPASDAGDRATNDAGNDEENNAVWREVVNIPEPSQENKWVKRRRHGG